MAAPISGGKMSGDVANDASVKVGGNAGISGSDYSPFSNSPFSSWPDPLKRVTAEVQGGNSTVMVVGALAALGAAWWLFRRLGL